MNCTAKEIDLILISYPEFFKGETDIVSSLLDQFDFTYHLRKPDASYDELESFLAEIPDYLHEKIVVSNSIEILERFKVKGIHFSTLNRENGNYLAGNCYRGTSCHSIDEIRKLDDSYDYVYLSPVFPSISKKGYKGNLNMEEIKKFFNESRKKQVYALGGIAAENMEQIREFGFDGLAVLGAVWTNDPHQNQDKIRSNFNKIYSIIQSIYEKSNS